MNKKIEQALSRISRLQKEAEKAALCLQKMDTQMPFYSWSPAITLRALDEYRACLKEVEIEFTQAAGKY